MAVKGNTYETVNKELIVKKIEVTLNIYFN